MIAVDTNVLVRLLTGDDPKQTAITQDLFASSGPIWIAKTVLLETGWVLRSLYGFDEAAISDAFASLLGLENVRVEDEFEIASALELTAQGIELADAIHLTGRPHDALFVSLDRAFVQRARRAGVHEVSNFEGLSRGRH
jgi:predicted nucleic-acid-binding protein